MELLHLIMLHLSMQRKVIRVIRPRRLRVTFSPTPQTAWWGRRTEPRKVPITCWKNSERCGALFTAPSIRRFQRRSICRLQCYAGKIYSVTEEFCMRLVEGMPKRCENVIAAQGKKINH